MGNANTDDERPEASDQSGESTLRGDALAGSERKRAVDHDAVIRTDDEEDTLYSDGLEVDDDAPPLGTPRGDEKAR
jgi:hypothetical protein